MSAIGLEVCLGMPSEIPATPPCVPRLHYGASGCFLRTNCLQLHTSAVWLRNTALGCGGSSLGGVLAGKKPHAAFFSPACTTSRIRQTTCSRILQLKVAGAQKCHPYTLQASITEQNSPKACSASYWAHSSTESTEARSWGRSVDCLATPDRRLHQYPRPQGGSKK